MSLLQNTVKLMYLRQHHMTLVSVCMYVFMCVRAWQTPGPAPCSSSQDKGMPTYSRQRVCRQKESTDKLCRQMAHRTVTLSPDNARSTVHPLKKTMRLRERLYLKCWMWDSTQSCSTRCSTCTDCPAALSEWFMCVWESVQYCLLESS